MNYAMDLKVARQVTYRCSHCGMHIQRRLHDGETPLAASRTPPAGWRRVGIRYVCRRCLRRG